MDIKLKTLEIKINELLLNKEELSRMNRRVHVEQILSTTLNELIPEKFFEKSLQFDVDDIEQTMPAIISYLLQNSKGLNLNEGYISAMYPRSILAFLLILQKVIAKSNLSIDPEKDYTIIEFNELVFRYSGLEYLNLNTLKFRMSHLDIKINQLDEARYLYLMRNIVNSNNIIKGVK